MFSKLSNHPFAVQAFFEQSTVLTFAVPKEQLQPLIPPCLSLDTFDDKYGFIAVAMVKTSQLRPKGFPAFMGNSFFLIGYRIFTRFIDQRGKRLRGLYILRSETNKRKMTLLGSIFTHYDYGMTDVSAVDENNLTVIQAPQSGLDVRVRRGGEELELPTDSPFENWKQARRFAGPLPFTFTWLPDKEEVLIIEGVRQNWKPKPMEIVNAYVPFLNELPISDFQLASAFQVEQVPYHWKKGRTEKWRP